MFKLIHCIPITRGTLIAAFLFILSPIASALIRYLIDKHEHGHWLIYQKFVIIRFID